MTRIFENHYVQITIWGSAAVAAAITSPTIFTVSFVAGGVFAAMNESVRMSTGKSLVLRAKNGFDKLMDNMPVDNTYVKKAVSFIKFSFGFLLAGSVAPKKYNPTADIFFNVLIPVVYGVTALVFSSPFFAALSAVKTVTLISRDVTHITFVTKK